MSDEIVKIILILEAALLLHFGLSLLLRKMPPKLVRSVYGHSRRLMGCVFLLLSAGIFGFYLSKIQELGAFSRIAYNLSLYYTSAVLMAVSFVTLIGKRPVYNSPKSLAYIASVVTFIAIAFVATTLDDVHISRTILISLSVYLLVSVIGFIIYFIRRYNQAILRGEAYYSEGIDIHIGWMKRCLYSIIGVGILSSIFAFSVIMPPWLRFVFLVYFIGACGYIYVSFLGFVKVFIGLSSLKIEDVDERLLDNTDNDGEEAEILAPPIEARVSTISSEVVDQLSARIDIWLEEKMYCHQDITINSVAKQLCTNRLYLSNYINVTCYCSFRVWVSTQRVEEAKRIMIRDKSKSITTISLEVGFLSLQSFTHTFKKLEGISPRKWIDRNVK